LQKNIFLFSKFFSFDGENGAKIKKVEKYSKKLQKMLDKGTSE
jgi:hypothetical protein